MAQLSIVKTRTPEAKPLDHRSSDTRVKHLYALSKNYKLTVWTDPQPCVDNRLHHVSAYALPDVNEILTYPIDSDERYAIALHEVGHCVDPHPLQALLPTDVSYMLDDQIDFVKARFYKLRSEWRAWKIAKELASFWNADCDTVCDASLASYAGSSEWVSLSHLYRLEWSERTQQGSEFTPLSLR